MDDRVPTQIFWRRIWFAGPPAALSALYLYAPGFFLGAVCGVLLLAAVQVGLLVHIWHRIRGTPAVGSGDDEALRPRTDDIFPAKSSVNVQEVVWVCAQLPGGEDDATSASPDLQRDENNRKNGGKKLSSRDLQRDENDKKPGGKKGKEGGGLDIPKMRLIRLAGQHLILVDKSGNKEVVRLAGCEVKIISGTTGQQRKWSRKYPIRILHKECFVWKSSHTCFLYLSSGFLKETWAVLLRTAAVEGVGNNSESWYRGLQNEYTAYWRRIRDKYDFWHESGAGGEADDVLDIVSAGKNAKVDGNGLRGRGVWLRKKLGVNKVLDEQIELSSDSGECGEGSLHSGGKENQQQPGKLKRFLRGSFGNLGPKTGPAAKQTGKSLSQFDSGSLRGDEFSPFQEVLTNSLSDTEGIVESPQISPSASIAGALNQHIGTSSSQSSSPGHNSRASSFGLGDANEGGPSLLPLKVNPGTQWVNTLLARLFFDMHRSAAVKATLKRKIQNKLEKIRTPSFMGPIHCTHFDLGNSPPLARGLRVLPLGPNNNVSLEADLEYYGGAKLTIQTRVDMRELVFLQDKVGKEVPDDGGDAAMAAGLLLEGAVETMGEAAIIEAENNDSGKGDRSWNKGGSIVKGFRSLLNHVVEQVSQVPLTLSVNISAIRGTARLQVSPPPTNCLWFAFVEMPELIVQTHPSIGELKIKANPIASFLLEKIKGAIRDSVVLPQSTDICLPFMLSDESDTALGEEPPFPWTAPHFNFYQSEPDPSSSTISNVSSSPQAERAFPELASAPRTPISEPTSTGGAAGDLVQISKTVQPFELRGGLSLESTSISENVSSLLKSPAVNPTLTHAYTTPANVFHTSDDDKGQFLSPLRSTDGTSLDEAQVESEPAMLQGSPALPSGSLVNDSFSFSKTMPRESKNQIADSEDLFRRSLEHQHAAAVRTPISEDSIPKSLFTTLDRTAEKKGQETSQLTKKTASAPNLTSVFMETDSNVGEKQRNRQEEGQSGLDNHERLSFGDRLDQGEVQGKTLDGTSGHQADWEAEHNDKIDELLSEDSLGEMVGKEAHEVLSRSNPTPGVGQVLGPDDVLDLVLRGKEGDGPLQDPEESPGKKAAIPRAKVFGLGKMNIVGSRVMEKLKDKDGRMLLEIQARKAFAYLQGDRDSPGELK